MSSDLGEDILEAILNTGKKSVSPNEIKTMLDKTAKSESLAQADVEMEKAVTCLKDKGYVTENKNKLSLTEKGEKKAASVARKHAVLESFFADVLGTKPDEASKQACVLEHKISNETINKLDSFLGERNPEYEDHNILTERNPIEPLCDCPEGSVLHIATIEKFAKHSRLIGLGIIPGELIELRRRLDNKSVVVKVKGCDIALSPEIASSIMVERCITK